MTGQQDVASLGHGGLLLAPHLFLGLALASGRVDEGLGQLGLPRLRPFHGWAFVRTRREECIVHRGLPGSGECPGQGFFLLMESCRL